jgi:hypothetical protein
MQQLKARYLKWVTSPQGPAPYFYRRYPKRVAAIRKNLGKDDKHRKRLPVPMDASDVEIMLALDRANRDFEASCRAYDDGETSKAMAEHEIKKAALALLKQFGLQPGDGAVLAPKDLGRIEDMLGEEMDKRRVIHGEVGLAVDTLLHEGNEQDTIESLTVQEAFAMYLQAKPNAKYERVLDRFLADVGNRVISQSINRHLHDWVHRQLQDRGVKTVQKDLSLIRAAMNYAIRANGINVVVHKPVFPEHESKARPVLSRDELKQLFGLEMEGWARQCLVASLCMGAINSELKELKVGDLDGTMLLRFPKGKTKFRERSVPMPFMNSWKPIKVGEARIRDRLTELIKMVNPDASPYSLRHSGEHYMTIAKISETDRAAIMGWANKGRFHQYGEAGKHNEERLMPLIDVMHETWDWLLRKPSK